MGRWRKKKRRRRHPHPPRQGAAGPDSGRLVGGEGGAGRFLYGGEAAERRLLPGAMRGRGLLCGIALSLLLRPPGRECGVSDPGREKGWGGDGTAAATPRPTQMHESPGREDGWVGGWFGGESSCFPYNQRRALLSRPGFVLFPRGGCGGGRGAERLLSSLSSGSGRRGAAARGGGTAPGSPGEPPQPEGRSRPALFFRFSNLPIVSRGRNDVAVSTEPCDARFVWFFFGFFLF